MFIILTFRRKTYKKKELTVTRQLFSFSVLLLQIRQPRFFQLIINYIGCVYNLNYNYDPTFVLAIISIVQDNIMLTKLNVKVWAYVVIDKLMTEGN